MGKDELGRLLDAAERGAWPAAEDETAWGALANWAFQQECLAADEAEDMQWEHQMRALAKRELPYSEFVAERMAALSYRLRTRKLTQANLRYKYGFRRARPWQLIRRAVREFYRAWSRA